MSVKFYHLSDQISKLLQLFEIAAKSFVKKQEVGGTGDKDLLQKIDALLEQNKVIARGLTLMEEKLRERIYSHQLITEERPKYPSPEL